MAEKITVRVRDALQGDSRIISLAFHPTEPFVVAGLQSGDVCLCVCRADALTAQVEHERANRCAESAPKTGAKSDPSGRFPYVGSLAPAAGWRLLRVLGLPRHPQEVVQHVHFLTGREEDLVRDLALPDVTAATRSAAGDEKSALRGRGRHLALFVTNLNSVLIVDVMQNKLVRFWDATSGKIWLCNKVTGALEEKDSVKDVHRLSPFHVQQMITQVGTYGALLFCVIARREDVERQNRSFHAKVKTLHAELSDRQIASGAATSSSRASAATLEDASMEVASRAPELLYSDIQHHYVYVCHLGFTHPFATPHKSQLGVGKGAYIITPKGKSNKLPIAFIRVHPLAPIVLTVTANAVRVYELRGGTKAVPYAVLQRPVAFGQDGGADITAPLLNSRSPASRPFTTTWLIDADFLPTAVVASTSHGGGSSSSLCATLENLSLALLTSYRLSIVDCSFSSEDKRTRTHADHTAAAAPAGAKTVWYTPRERAYVVPRNGGLRYQRLQTWLGSPSTVLVQQSDRQLVEYTEGDVLPMASRLLTLRSERTLPRRCGYSWFIAPRATGQANAGGVGTSAASTAMSATATACCFAVRASRLPTWGLQDRLPFSDVSSSGSAAAGANPLVDAAGAHRVVFSSPTHIAAWQSTCCADTTREARDKEVSSHFRITSVIADTSSVDTSSICFTVALSHSGSSAASAAAASSSPQGRVLTVTRVLGTAPVALIAFEHSFYFVGSRQQAANTFLVGGLVYAEKMATVKPVTVEDGTENTRTTSIAHTTRMHAALFCCPATSEAVQQAAHVAEVQSAAKGGAPVTASVENTTMARYAGVYHVPTPCFAAVDGDVRGDEKELLSTSFQLTNDSHVMPCVWSLWAPPRGRKQIVLQRFSIAEDVAAPMWAGPQLITIRNSAYENPSQIFSLATVGGMRCAWPQEASIVGQLFLFYEESNVLVLATVERGSRYVVSSSSYGRMLFASEASAADYGAGDLTDSRQRPSTNSNSRDVGGGDGELHLMPQAAVELPGWGAGGSGASSGPLQLTATLSSDGNALLVAVAARRHGFVIAEFPVIGRLGDAAAGAGSPGSGVATLIKERVLCAKRWCALSLADGSGDSWSTNGDEDEDEEAEAEEAADRQRTSAEMMNLSPGQRAVRQSQRREARALRCAPHGASWDESRSPVALFQWIFFASGARSIASIVPQNAEHMLRDRGTGSSGGGDGSAVAGDVVSFVLIQRFRRLFAVHPSGHVTCLCPGINNCVPHGVCYAVTQCGGSGGEASRGAALTVAQQSPAKEGTSESAPSARSAKPSVPPLPLGQLTQQSAINADATSTGEPALVLRIAVQYGDYAGLLPHIHRCRQRYTQAVFARSCAPQLSLEGADGVVPFVPGSGVKQSKGRRRSGNRSAPTPLGNSHDPTTERHAREVRHVMERSSRHEAITAMSEDVYARVPVWVSTAAAALHLPSWTVVQDMDITDPLRAAVVRMHAAEVSQSMTQLITASVLLTSSIRTTFAALRHELDESAAMITGQFSQAGSVASLLGGDLPTAQVLATVPLSSVTICLAHELSRAKQYDDALRNRAENTRKHATKTADPVDAEALTQSRLSLQRWWLLAVQSYVLVNALNDDERDRSASAVNRVLTVEPNPFAYSSSRSSNGPTAASVGDVMLYCPIMFHPAEMWGAVVTQSPAPTSTRTDSTGGVSEFLQAAVRHALSVLSGKVQTAATTSAITDWLPAMLASLALDGAHWVTSVLLDRLYYNIKGIAEGTFSSCGTEAVDAQLVSTARSLVSVMDGSTEVQTAAAVVEVAASTVATLKGTGYSISNPSREKMAAAVAVSVSRRKKVMGVATPRVLGGTSEQDTPRGLDAGMSALLRRLDEQPAVNAKPEREHGEAPPAATTAAAAARDEQTDAMPQDVLLRPPGASGASDELRARPDTALLARLDRLRATVYATHWRALYDLSGYDALCWHAGRETSKSSSPPSQITCDPARTAVPRRRAVDDNTTKSPAADRGSSAHDTAVAHKADEGVTNATSTAVELAISERLDLPTRQSMGGGGVDSRAYAPPTPAELQAMLASEEAAMRTNYFNGFATAVEPSAVAGRSEDTPAKSAQDELRELQARIAAPPSISTRTRRTDGEEVSTAASGAAPLNAEDFFRRMADSEKNESDVW